MSKVDKRDLQKVNSKITFLESIESENKKIVSLITSFNTNSRGILIGDSYDAIRNKLELFKDAFNKQATICTNLQNNIIAVNNSMINFMGEYNTLDDSYMEKTRVEIENAEKRIIYLRNLLSTYRQKGDASSVNKINNAINTLQESIINLKKILEKLKMLNSKDRELKDKLNNVTTDIKNFESAVNSINLFEI